MKYLQKLGLNKRLLLIILILVCVFGLFMSLFLTYEYYNPAPLVCTAPAHPNLKSSCEEVRESPYAEIFGVKLPVWGSIYFTSAIVIEVIILFTYLTDRKLPEGIITKQKYLHILLLSILVMGILFESTMTGIEIFVIKALCTWCAMIETVAILNLLIGLLYLLPTPKKVNTKLGI